MPTWRDYLVERRINNKNNPKLKNHFKDSTYFRHISNFLNNRKLHLLLKANGLTMIFYPHYEMQSGLSLFTINCDEIIAANKTSHDIPQLLKESLMMITDYSGVGFDFAYMYKPLLYYQFDKEDYYTKHYPKGDFDMDKDGLGQVIINEEDLINAIENIINRNFELEEKYKERITKLFTFHDSNNCERIYNAIINYRS